MTTTKTMTTTKKKKTVTTIGHSFPLDLIIEILLRLPAKSVFRFRSVSKSWCSIINSKKFTDAFMSLSLSRPRLVFAFSARDKDRLFFSSPHQNCSFGSSSSSMFVAEKKNILTVPEFKPYCLYRSNSIRGFICCGVDDPFVVCNPTTRQVIYMPPEPNSDYDDCAMYLGYDPNGDQYKVLRLVNSPDHSRIEHSVCTLGAQGSSYTWRPIKTNIPDFECCQNGVCIDGVVYYDCPGIQDHRNTIGSFDHRNTIGSFDVGSEQVCLIEVPVTKALIEIPEDYVVRLTNYLGKLGVYCSYRNGFILCVLEDAKNQVWSKKTGVFHSFTSSMLYTFRFAGITATREIVYLPSRVSDSFELFCYDIEKKTERRVRVQGISEYHGFYSSLLCSYVENIATI